MASTYLVLGEDVAVELELRGPHEVRLPEGKGVQELEVRVDPRPQQRRVVPAPAASALAPQTPALTSKIYIIDFIHHNIRDDANYIV